MPADWQDLSPRLSEGNARGNAWMLAAGPLQVFVQRRRLGNGKFASRGPWLLRYQVADGEAVLVHPDLPAAQAEAVAIVRRALEAALAALLGRA